MYILGKNVEDLMEMAIYKNNYEAIDIMIRTPYNVSTVESLVYGSDYCILGCAVIPKHDITCLLAMKDPKNFWVIKSEDDFNNFKDFSPFKKIKDKNEGLENAQEIDTKIKEVIKKYTPKGNEEKIEEIFNLVKEAENKSSEKVTEIMVTVFKMGYNQSQTTEIFMANSNLKVNKNTLVIKRDIKED